MLGKAQHAVNAVMQKLDSLPAGEPKQATVESGVHDPKIHRSNPRQTHTTVETTTFSSNNRSFKHLSNPFSVT